MERSDQACVSVEDEPTRLRMPYLPIWRRGRIPFLYTREQRRRGRGSGDIAVEAEAV